MKLEGNDICDMCLIDPSDPDREDGLCESCGTTVDQALYENEEGLSL